MRPAVSLSAYFHRLRRLVHPDVDSPDPEEAFQLRVLRTQAQLTSSAFFVPILIYLLDVASRPSPLYLHLIAAGAGAMSAACLWLLSRRAKQASRFILPVAFLLPDIVIFLGLTVEIVSATLITMFYAGLVLSPAVNVILHAVHLSILLGAAALTDTYTIFPRDGDVNSTHYLSTYLILHAVAAVYTWNLRAHLQAVTKTLQQRSRELAYLNEHLEDELERRTEQLAEQQEELERRRRAEVAAQIASGVAHDISNIFAILRMNMDVLDAEGVDRPDSEAAAAAFRRIDRALKRGRSLVERMFSAVRQGPTVQLTPVDLGDALDAVVDLARSTLPAHVRLVREGPHEPVVVDADPTQIEQVFLNLIQNSIFAIGDEPGEVRIATRATERRVVVEVVDTGGGIPPHLVDRVFEPFFTTKPQGRGTGLGLAQVRRIVLDHGGDVSLDSSVGFGTTVRVELPRRSAEHADRPASATAPAEPLHPDDRPFVLLAEDEDDIAEVVAAALPATRVARARNVREAIRLLAVVAGNLDLLILDVTLPGGSGEQVFEAARRKFPSVPVLVTTGRLHGDEVVRITQQAWTFLLPKPFQLRELRQAVAKALGGPWVHDGPAQAHGSHGGQFPRAGTASTRSSSGQ